MALQIVHTESSVGWGGQEIRILTEAQGMLKRGHRVTLLCPVEAGIRSAAERRGVPVEALPISRKGWKGLLAIRGYLKRHPEIDVVNTHSSTDSWLAAVACLGWRNAPPIVRTRHVSSPVKDNAPTRWLYQKATRKIVTTGDALRRELHERNGFRWDTIVSVPTGIDLAAYRPGEPGEKRRLGIVATLRNWKGHSYLLESFARLRRELPDWELVIVGSGPQERNLRRRVDELGLGGAVRMVGNQENVVPWLQAMDLFVLPSYGEEGAPQAIMQAMACGLPVVSTTVGAIGEVVVHGETGLLVPPRDVEALTSALRTLIQDADLRRKMGNTGRARALERFGIDRMLDAMEGVFASVVRS